MRAGDTCLIRAGRYCESVQLANSGKSGRPILFKAVPGERVVIDGTDPVEGGWRDEGKGVYSTVLRDSTEQLFFEYKPMMWARYPNMTFDQNWQDEKKWARTDAGSEVGLLRDAGVEALGVSLKGALVYIKLGKGNNCFSRRVLKHRAGSSDVSWDAEGFLDNPRLTAEDGQSEKIKQAGLVDNRFFIKGVKGLLDAEHEWFYESSSKTLSFAPPGGGMPTRSQVRVKVREYGVQSAGQEHIQFEGIEFFACSARFERMRFLTLDRCHFYYPYELHRYHDNVQVVKDQRPVYVQGENNRLKGCLVQYAPGTSLYMLGRKSELVDSVVCEGSRHGRHNDPNITVRYDHLKRAGRDFVYAQKKGNRVSHCTVFNGSGIGVYLLGRGPGTAEYNHVFNVGQYCTDVSALYIPLGKNRQWTGFHHNWVHDINGIGIRCDQDGEQVLFHHNVVWNCKAGGKANGYACRIFNNTIFVNNPNHAFLIVKQGQDELMSDWPVQNNVAYRLADRRDLRELKKMSKQQRKKRPFIMDLENSESIHHNHVIGAQSAGTLFVNTDENAIDLRPCKGSALIDAGVRVPGMTDGFQGRAPDIGAYEYGGPYWTAGASWWPEGKTPPQTMSEATQRAHRMSGGIRFYRNDHQKYRKQ